MLQSSREYRHSRIAGAIHEWRRLTRIRKWRPARIEFDTSAAIRDSTDLPKKASKELTVLQPFT